MMAARAKGVGGLGEGSEGIKKYNTTYYLATEIIFS